MTAGLALRTGAVVAGRAIGAAVKAFVIDNRASPTRGAVTSHAIGCGLHMVSGLASGHGAVVATCAIG